MAKKTIASVRAKRKKPLSRKVLSKRTPSRKALKVKPKAVAKSALKPAQSKKSKWVYSFGGGKAEGKSEMRNLLGGKGAGLAEMANLGLPVPPGFTIPTSVCTYFYEHDKTHPKELKGPGEKALGYIGKPTGKAAGAA